jgi:hypothetical protein
MMIYSNAGAQPVMLAVDDMLAYESGVSKTSNRTPVDQTTIYIHCQ